MRVCTKCNRMLRDDETSCPYCGCAIITDEPDLTPTAAQGNPRTPDLFATTIIELPKNLGKAPVEDSEPDEVLEDNFEFPKAPLDANGELMSNAAPAPVREGALLEQLVDEQQLGTPASEELLEDYRDSDSLSRPTGGISEDAGSYEYDYESDAYMHAAPPAPIRFHDDEGDLERQYKKIEKNAGAKDESSALSKLGVSLLAIVVLAALALTVACLVKYMKTPNTSDDTIMLEYISGEWLSEPYTYADDMTQGFVELLTINADNTFSLKSLVPDPRNENGWKDGSWEDDYAVSGELELFVDSKCIILHYTEFGKKYSYVRYIVNVDDKSLTLRELYDDAGDKYYDMVYKRV